MLKDILVNSRKHFEEFFDFYRHEIAVIRTGRATPLLVEDLFVEYYGEKYRLKELASITVPEPKMLLIQPWDKGAVEAISGAIQRSNLSINPVTDGQGIRLSFPQLTQERRREFIKLLKQKTEETRIKIRRTRDEVRDKIHKMEKFGEIGEDEKFKAQNDLQKLVDEYNHNIEELEKNKESELMTS